MLSIIINGESVDEKDQAALAEAYAAGSKPICSCVSEGIPLTIAKKNQLFFIRRLPKSGHLHHLGCPRYEMPAVLSGRGELQESAIKVQDDDSSVLSIDFKMAVKDKKMVKKEKESSEASEGTATVEASKKALTLKATLDFLYETAELTHWTNDMHRQRSWASVKKAIISAAGATHAKGHSLSDVLYMPEPYNADKREEQQEQFDRYIHKMAQRDRGEQLLGLIIAPVKIFPEEEDEGHMVFTHMPDVNILVDKSMVKRVYKSYEEPLALSMERPDEFKLLAIAHIHVTMAENISLLNLGFISLDSRWLPSKSMSERLLLNHLVKEQLPFRCCLTYNRPIGADTIMASVVYEKAGVNNAVIVPTDTSSLDYLDNVENTVKDADLPFEVWSRFQKQCLSIDEYVVEEKKALEDD